MIEYTQFDEACDLSRGIETQKERIAELEVVVARHTDIYAAERQQADQARDERDEAVAQLAKQEQELASRLKAHSEFAFEMGGLVAERDKRIAELEAVLRQIEDADGVLGPEPPYLRKYQMIAIARAALSQTKEGEG